MIVRQALHVAVALTVRLTLAITRQRQSGTSCQAGRLPEKRAAISRRLQRASSAERGASRSWSVSLPCWGVPFGRAHQVIEQRFGIGSASDVASRSKAPDSEAAAESRNGWARGSARKRKPGQKPSEHDVEAGQAPTVQGKASTHQAGTASARRRAAGTMGYGARSKQGNARKVSARKTNGIVRRETQQGKETRRYFGRRHHQGQAVQSRRVKERRRHQSERASGWEGRLCASVGTAAAGGRRQPGRFSGEGMRRNHPSDTAPTPAGSSLGRCAVRRFGGSPR